MAPIHTRAMQTGPTRCSLMAALASISTSTLGHFTHQGYLRGVRPQWTDVHMVGRVRTVQVALPSAAILRQALLQAQAGEVLLVECIGDPELACWGELRNLAAQVKQLAGVIVLGKVTDIRALRAHRLPVFAMGISALTTRPASGEPTPSQSGSFDQTLMVGGRCIRSGDIALGDDDGVFVLSADEVRRWLPVCMAKEAAEQAKREELMGKLMATLTCNVPDNARS